MRRILVVGATAAMVRETLRLFAADGACLALAARDSERCEDLARALRDEGAVETQVLCFHAERADEAAPLVDRAVELLRGLDAVLVAHGELPDQLATERDPEALASSLAVNGTSAVQIAVRAAYWLEPQGRGCIAVISSGAGERGRRVTYTYGMGKSLVTTCLQGLRARLHPRGVAVVTILPCFVDTPMTADLPARMRFVSARSAGTRIHRAMRRGTDVVYIPRPWLLPLLAVRVLPEWWAKRSTAEERYARRIGRWPLGAESAGEDSR